MRLAVIGIGLLSLALSSCIEKVDLEALQAEAIEIEKQLDELRNQKKARYNELNAKKKSIRDFEYLANKEADLRLEFNPIENYVNSLKVADEYVATQLEIWRKATRESLKGRTLGTFRTSSGVEVANGVVTEVGDEEVVIKFGGAEQSFPWSELPEQLRLALVHEPTVTVKNQISNF